MIGHLDSDQHIGGGGLQGQQFQLIFPRLVYC